MFSTSKTSLLTEWASGNSSQTHSPIKNIAPVLVTMTVCFQQVKLHYLQSGHQAIAHTAPQHETLYHSYKPAE